MIALGWHTLYAVIGMIGFLIFLYIAFWTLIYALAALGGLLMLAAGWGYAICIVLANAWRLPYLAVAFPYQCVRYWRGLRASPPTIAGRWEDWMTPKHQFRADWLLWCYIVAGPLLLLWAYNMPWIFGVLFGPPPPLPDCAANLLRAIRAGRGALCGT